MRKWNVAAGLLCIIMMASYMPAAITGEEAKIKTAREKLITLGKLLKLEDAGGYTIKTLNWDTDVPALKVAKGIDTALIDPLLKNNFKVLTTPATDTTPSKKLILEKIYSTDKDLYIVPDNLENQSLKDGRNFIVRNSALPNFEYDDFSQFLVNFPKTIWDPPSIQQPIIQKIIKKYVEELLKKNKDLAMAKPLQPTFPPQPAPHAPKKIIKLENAGDYKLLEFTIEHWNQLKNLKEFQKVDSPKKEYPISDYHKKHLKILRCPGSSDYILQLIGETDNLYVNGANLQAKASEFNTNERNFQVISYDNMQLNVSPFEDLELPFDYDILWNPPKQKNEAFEAELKKYIAVLTKTPEQPASISSSTADAPAQLTVLAENLSYLATNNGS